MQLRRPEVLRVRQLIRRHNPQSGCGAFKDTDSEEIMMGGDECHIRGLETTDIVLSRLHHAPLDDVLIKRFPHLGERLWSSLELLAHDRQTELGSTPFGLDQKVQERLCLLYTSDAADEV